MKYQNVPAQKYVLILQRYLSLAVRSFSRDYKHSLVRTFSHNTIGFLSYTSKRFFNDKCFQRAASLTYTTLLGLIPLLTIIFYFFSVFPVFSQLRKQAQDAILFNFLPEVGTSIQAYINIFMQNAQQSTAFGVIGLLIVAILLFWTIESAFRTIWHVSDLRSLWMRFLLFWTVLTCIPILFATILSLPTFFEKWGIGVVTDQVSRLLGYLPIFFEFLILTIFYRFIPNRPVRLRDAAIGGSIAATAFEVSKIGFSWYIKAFPIYETIYGALSTVPIFLVWLFVVWCTVLFGAVITAAIPEWQDGQISRNYLLSLPDASRIIIALALLQTLFEAIRQGKQPYRQEIIKQVNVGAILVEHILEQLAKAGWVARISKGDIWVLTRDLSNSTLYDLEQSLGIGIKGTINDITGLDPLLKTHITSILEQSQTQHQNIMNINIVQLFNKDFSLSF